MESFLLGVGIIISFVVWNAWKKTALDECRDTLFDIRDSAREYFVEHGIKLDTPVYIELRSLINAHIRYTTKLTFPVVMSVLLAKGKHPEIIANLRIQVERRLHTDDAGLARKIQEWRDLANDAMIKYLGETSAFLIFSFAVLWPLFTVMKLIRRVSLWLMRQSDLVSINIKVLFRWAPIIGCVLAAPARAGLVDKNMVGTSLIEEYSYEASLEPRY